MGLRVQRPRPGTRSRPRLRLASLRSAGWALAVSALACPPAGAEGAAAGMADRFARLAGAWAGELMYVDYGSGGEVTLPAVVTVEAPPGSGVIVSRVAFRDPGTVVESLDVSRVDPASGQFVSDTFQGGAVEHEEWSISRMEDTEAGWSIVLSGMSTDSGRPVDVRITRTLEGDRLTSTKQIRPRGDENATWLVRNELRLTRVVPGAADLVGTWRIDLRPTPDADPYYQEFVVTEQADGTFAGTFYGTEIQEARINTDWGDPRFAFVTDPGSSPYYTSGRLVDGRLEGTTHSLERDFVSVWSAERATP